MFRSCLPSPVEKDANVTKSVRFESPENIIPIIQNFSENKELSTYRNILEQLQKGDIEEETCATWFKQLEDNIIILNSLTGNHKVQFINILLNGKWIWKSSDHLIERYCSFIECLLAFNADYTSLVVVYLMPLFISKCNEDKVIDIGVSNDDEARLYQYLHRLLSKIVKLVPMAVDMVMEKFLERFPMEICDGHMQISYVINLLKSLGYLPNFRKQALEQIFARLKMLDFECPWEQVQEAEKTSICESLPENQDPSLLFRMKHKQANLLDVMMKVTFTYMRDCCYSNNKIDAKKTRILYKELLGIFHRQMVGVFETTHVQFLMFYVCSYHLKLCRAFIDYLWKQVIDITLSNKIRIWAACYLGSFIVRHVTIPASTVRDCLHLMKDWVHEYIDKHKREKQSSSNNHSCFYVVCQTIFYVIGYRIDELMTIPDASHFISTLHLNSIISSTLLPLKFCSPSVVDAFACKAKEYQLAYCQPFLIREVNPQQLPAQFFPFDPYILARSNEFIEPIYRFSIQQVFFEHPLWKEDSQSEDEAAMEDMFVDDDDSTRDSIQSFILD